jgi:hypothetical protein
MAFSIATTDGGIELVDASSQDEKKFVFNLSSTVNMTDLVHYISDREQKIECHPSSLEEFKAEHKEEMPETFKLVEYVFKVINAFNESYDEVFKEEVTE